MVIFTDSSSAKEDIVSTLIKCIKKYRPTAIYLREKQLSDDSYLKLAQEILAVCKKFKVAMYVCHRVEIARRLGIKNLHLNLKNLSKIGTICDFENISVSIHSINEVKEAVDLGATCLVYGHIFPTVCKLDLPPRGVESLINIVEKTRLPVIAIGGINSSNYNLVLQAGASDFAIMSSAMNLTF